ncbi:MAG: NADH-quinone oxidoreductase subunit M [Verrucomicrobiae bacterium]|jgi:NADH-quinone oxidoreductase subunit M|nr:NADH-quinone oxidoreductase subunit M [Verrucomicrobiae bacterium]
MLAWTIILSFAGALGVLLVPKALVRWVALVVACAGLACGFFGAIEFGGGPVSMSIVDLPWIAPLGVRFALEADGIGVTLVLLTGIAAVVGVLFSWNIEKRLSEYFAFFLTLIGGVYGVFLSADLFLLFVFYEIAIVPKYFLIAIWGGTRKDYGAMKLVLYSFAGSALVLIGILAAFVAAGGSSFALIDLAQAEYSVEFQRWAFPLVFVGFAVLAGLWPFHTWAPTGHVAAPTPVSMLLAGVVMKLGAYGALKVALPLFPEGAIFWRDILAALAVTGIVYGGLVAMTQKDFKFVIGYSSVSHMGFVLLGVATLNETGLSGAVLQMFSHGILAGLLFGIVGRLVYDRTHTRNLDELKSLNLRVRMPFAAGAFTVAGMASMGMPGFSGFVAELHVLIGAWRSVPVHGIIAGIGVVIGVAYTMKAIQTVFFTDAGDTDPGVETSPTYAPFTVPERAGVWMLSLTSLLIGLYPRILLDWITPTFQTPLYEGLRKGAGW